MEKEGFVRAVTRLDDLVGLRAVSTDRHIQIRKLMATDERFMHIIHQFDPWHLAKNISKNLVKLAKKKGLLLCFLFIICCELDILELVKSTSA